MAKDESGLYVAALGAIIFCWCFIGMSDTALPAAGDRNSEVEDRETDSHHEANPEMNNQEALGNDRCIDKKFEKHNDYIKKSFQNQARKKVNFEGILNI